MTTDLKVIHHVLFNCYDYPKTMLLRHVFRTLFGNGGLCCINLTMPLQLFYIGLLNAEGDEHKHQVQFLFQDLFANCCLILQIAQDFGQLYWPTGVLNV